MSNYTRFSGVVVLMTTKEPIDILSSIYYWILDKNKMYVLIRQTVCSKRCWRMFSGQTSVKQWELRCSLATPVSGMCMVFFEIQAATRSYPHPYPCHLIHHSVPKGPNCNFVTFAPTQVRVLTPCYHDNSSNSWREVSHLPSWCGRQFCSCVFTPLASIRHLTGSPVLTHLHNLTLALDKIQSHLTADASSSLIFQHSIKPFMFCVFVIWFK